MKVAIISPAYPYRGGIANFSERLAYELSLEKDDIQLYTFSMMYPDFLFPGRSQYATSDLQFPLKIERTINSINPFNWWKVGNKIRKQNFDLVLVAYSIPFLSPCLSVISRIIKRNPKTKVISIIHNLHPHEKKIGDNLLSHFFLNSCDAHLSLSGKVGNDIKTMKNDAVVIAASHPIYDTFGTILEKNQAKKILQLKENICYILFFGMIRKYKGLDLLIDAMADVSAQNKNIQMIIAGESYEPIEKYEQQIKTLNLSDFVILKNQFIPESEVNQYFCAADVVVQPYKNATQSGITQICYHFNKPMIVTNVGGLAENVSDNKVGFVCKPDKNALADAILKFYNEEKESIFIENIQQEKQKYSWRNLVGQLKSKFYQLQGNAK